MTEDRPIALTPEQIAACAASGGMVHAEDPATHSQYLLVEKKPEDRLPDDYIREKVQAGLDQLDRGESIPWDIEAIKARLADRLEANG